MAERKRSRVLIAAVFGLELALLALGVYMFVEMVTRREGKGLPDVWQLGVLAAAMVVVYLMYLKKGKEVAEDRVVGEKFRTGALLEAMPAAAMLLDESGAVLGANLRAAQALGVDELELSVGRVDETVGGELGRRLAGGAVGSFLAAAAGGGELRCTASPIGAEGARRGTRLVILEIPAEEKAAPGASAAPAEDIARRCAEAVGPLLERSSEHLAALAAAGRCASPHEADRAAQLAGVAVRLLQAGRRIRLARELALIEAGSLAGSLAAETFSLAAAAREVCERAKSLFAATGVELAAELPEGQVQVRADRGRTALVLRDLLEVCLAMTAAGGKVTVSLAQAGGQVEVAVTDTGCGMSREELEGLFSAEGSPPVHEAYTGGIRDGLFVAKEIMEASGGQLWAESAPGRGTRFNLRLPAA